MRAAEILMSCGVRGLELADEFSARSRSKVQQICVSLGD
jgi:hypothetical protein